MKKLLLAFLALALTFAYAADKQKLLVNITDNDTATAPMAVMFAVKSLQNGFETSVLLNSRAVTLAVKEFKSPACPHGNQTVRQKLLEFVKMGGKVYVCPMCLDAQGYSKSSVLDAFTLGGADVIMPLMKEVDKVISY